MFVRGANGEFTRVGWLAAALLLAVPPAVFAVLRLNPSFDRELNAPTFHFYVVSAIAGLALVLAGAVILAARRLPDPRTFFLAMGFLSMASIFLAHGLGTSPFFDQGMHAVAPTHVSISPGDGGARDPYASPAGHVHSQAGPSAAHILAPSETHIARMKVVGYSAQLSLLVSGVFLALATVRPGPRLSAIVLAQWPRLVACFTAALGGHVLVSLFWPQLLSWIPMSDAWLRYSTTSVAIACLALAGWRFFRSYRLALLPLQGAMALGAVLLIEAQVFMTWGVFPRASWWEYHVVMLAGFSMCVGSLLTQYRLTGDLGAIVEGLFLRHEVRGLRAGDPRALVALGAAIAAKDTETAEHIERVGELAVGVGRRLGLDEERLELVRWAGRLHDVGKIGVPNSILRKPAALTEREFEVIQLHSPRGGNIAARSALLAQSAAIIRAHHERMDGSGYPDGLRGNEIPLEARIVAVADVWDALTCDRPYRKALPPSEAAALMRQQAGAHLDPGCVAALLDLVSEAAWKSGAA
jgi:HD-GYP domain-containing protein (c-di-GMP phosphodiesterase class II)